MSFGSKMTAIANEIRTLVDTSESMGLDAMANNLSEANTEVNDQTDLINQINAALEGKAVGVGEQATPVISVDPSNGLIIATAGVKASNYQLAFQPAKTITPSTISQIAVSSGYYTGGDITVEGDSNLIAENIKSGVSIFGVNGTLEESSEDADEIKAALINRTFSTYTDDNQLSIGPYAFAGCSRLTTVSFPACTSIGDNAFNACTRLTTVSFPACTSIGGDAFRYCSSLLTTVSFPACTSIGNSAFWGCYKLTSVSFPACTSIGYYGFCYCSSLTTVSFPACTNIRYNAFSSCNNLAIANLPVCATIDRSIFLNCYRLSQLYLTGSSVCTLSNSNAFSSTPFAGYSTYFSGTPYIYVPASLLTTYQSATNWVYFSSYFSAYDDGTSTTITFSIDGTSYEADKDMTWAE